MTENSFSSFFVIASALAMIGCGSSPSQQYPAVPIADTNAFLQELEAKSKSLGEQRSKMIKASVDYWIQPANITQPCKVWYASPEGTDGVTINWDGRCHDGYAKGLGRAFLDNDRGLVAFLEEYPGGRNKPKNHYGAAYDYNTTWLGEESKGGSKKMQAFNTPDGFYVLQRYYREEGNSITYSAMTTSNLDGARWSRFYPGGLSLNFFRNDDPTNPLARGFYYADEEGKTIGYSVNGYRNGAVQQLSWDGNKSSNVRLPTAFTDQMTAASIETSAKIDEAYQAAEKSQVALNIYKRRICNGDITVDYMDSEIYGQICLEYGDLSKFSTQIAAAQAEAVQRQEVNKERALRQQEIAANRAAAQASQNAANAASQAAQIQSFTNSLQTLGNSMQESARSTAAFTNTINSSNQNNSSPSWGLPQNKVTNCMVMGNIVSCR